MAPSTLVDGTAYAIDDAHKMGDNAPYAFVTHDFGKSWTTIVGGLPPDQWARSIRPDVRDRNLVYLGTEEGIWISFDGGAHWQSFKNDLPAVSVRDIRLQAAYDDLVIATHGRDVYIMDDVRPVQELQQAEARGTWLFTPRAGYEWTLHPTQEETYTNYAADNPPYGIIITFYQKEPQTNAPSLDILDDRGRVIRTVSGTHKVHGKEEPYIPNKAGLNRYTWDFNVNGPVKWNGASLDFLNGPDDGPGVVPGSYSARMTLSKHTYVVNFRVEPDPRSRFTQAEYQRTFDEAMRQMAHLSQIDTVLNNLDDLKKSLDAALASAKKGSNTGLTVKLQEASTARQALFDSLAAHVRGEGTEDETKLHEELLSAFQNAQGLITPPVVDFLSRVDAEYRAGIGRYDAFVTGVLPGVNAALQQAGMKSLPAVKSVNAI